MSGLICQHLAPEQVRVLYPLVREAVPGLELKTWLQFARRIGNPRRRDQEGIIVVLREHRLMPCGLFFYRRHADLEHGEMLVAEHFVAVDVLDPAPVMNALVTELDRLANRLGCNAIRTVVLGATSAAATRLTEAGHRPAGAMLFKPVEIGGSPN